MSHFWLELTAAFVLGGLTALGILYAMVCFALFQKNG